MDAKNGKKEVSSKELPAIWGYLYRFTDFFQDSNTRIPAALASVPVLPKIPNTSRERMERMTPLERMLEVEVHGTVGGVGLQF